MAFATGALLAGSLLSSQKGGGGFGGLPGLGGGGGGGQSTDNLASRSGNITDNRIINIGGASNIGELIRIANEGSASNGGAGIIRKSPNLTGRVSVDSPVGAFEAGGDFSTIALLVAAAIGVVFFARKR